MAYSSGTGVVLFLLLLLWNFTSSNSKNLSCQTGWTLKGATCYKLYTEKLEHEDAANTCKSYGSRLVDIYGYTEAEVVGNVVKASNPDIKKFHIGFSVDPDNGKAYISDGTEVGVGQGFWGSLQPSAEGGCALLHTEGKGLYKYEFILESCRIKRPFVCEMDPCLSGMFQCVNGNCIKDSYKCDGQNDCGDRSDELNCEDQCTFHLKQPTGTIRAVYESSSHCQWTIETAPGTQAKLKFTAFNTEALLDEVQIWAGGRTVEESRFLRRISGAQPVENIPVFYSLNNFFIITFITDTSIILSGGFTAQFDTIMPPEDDRAAGQLQATATVQELLSDNFPNFLLSSVRQTWVISTTLLRKVISLKLAEMDLGPGASVEVYDGGDTNALQLARYQAREGPSLVVGTKDKMTVYLHTTEQYDVRGFQFFYVQGCTGDITASHGVITSPGYKVTNYPNLQVCTFSVSSPEGQPLKVVFDPEFGLEENKDYLQLYEGTDDTGPSLGDPKYTGEIAPKIPVIVPSGKIFFKLTTSAIINDKGFSASFGINCPEPEFNGNTVADSTATTLGDVINVECQPGYFFAQEEHENKVKVTMTCTASGWDVDCIPQCEPVYCGQVPDVEHAFVKSVSEPKMQFNSVAEYECFGGYSLQGSSTIQCQANANWGFPPSCQVATCTDLSDIQDGSKSIVNGSGTDFGTIISFVCDSGYELVGHPRLHCTANGWSSTEPSCTKLKCPLPSIEHAALSTTNPVDFGGVLSVTCDTGYAVMPALKTTTVTVTCNSDQTFEDVLCEDIDECTSSTFVHDCDAKATCINTVGSFKCTCPDGYTLSENGKLCEDIDECEPNGGLGPCAPSSMFGRCENLEGSYKCTCEQGFTLYIQDGTSGYKIADGETGLKTGDLFHINHTCVPKVCVTGDLRTLENGVALTTKERFVFMEKISYQCDLGFMLSGQQTLTCMDDGNWDYPKPSCSVATCEIPSVSGLSYPPTFSSSQPVDYGVEVDMICTQHRPANEPYIRKRKCSYDKPTNTYKLVFDNDLNCPIIDCGQIPLVSGASYIPADHATVYNTEVPFACKSTYTKKGSSNNGDSIVRCQKNGRWDFGDLECAGLGCTDPGTPPGAVQHATSYEEGSVVTFNCTQPGFGLDNNTPFTCVHVGTGAPEWNQNTLPSCVDIEDPVFSNCPTEEIVIDKLTSPDNALNFMIPIANDNSGIKQLSVSPEGFQPSNALTSNLVVTYRAEDFVGQVAECVINIRVKDAQNPVITCPESYIEYATEAGLATVPVRKEATATDNVQTGLTITYSPETINLGEAHLNENTVVTATATDQDGNTAICKYMVTVKAAPCKDWSLRSPVNGLKQCRNDGSGGYSCTMSCNAGFYFYGVTDSTTLSFTCSPGGEWTNGGAVPDCTAPTMDALYIMNIKTRYQSVDNSSVPNTCFRQYQATFENQLVGVGSTLTDIATHCAALFQNTVFYDITLNGDRDITAEITGPYVYITYSVNMGPRTLSDTEVSLCAGVLVLSFSNLAGSVQDVKTLKGINECPDIKLTSGGTQTLEDTTEYTCEEGDVVFISLSDGSRNKRVCLPCPTGTFFSSNTQTCIPCAVGSYAETSGQSQCTPCPDGTTTYSTGSVRSDQCLRTCYKYSMKSKDGNKLPICIPCEKNKYPTENDICEDCPANTATEGPGADSREACKAACVAGEYSITGFAGCKKCPKHFYQAASGAITCTECANSAGTVGEGSTRSSQCLILANTECSINPCMNSGTCLIKMHTQVCECAPGYTGELCETQIDFCESNPCYFGGTCQPTVNGFTCQCPTPAYSGDRCENEPNDCPSGAAGCQNNGMCQDDRESFNCLCLEGYTGDRCQVTDDICVTSPCKNGATCVKNSVRRTCNCVDGWTGDDCSVNIDDCSSNPCLYGGTCQDLVNDYKCVCPPEYQGKNCDVRPNVCALNQCAGSGVCVDNYRDMDVLCLCNAGYTRLANATGMWYEEILGVSQGSCSLMNLCDHYEPCQNDATCTPSTDDYKCTCKPGYEGYDCQRNINECEGDPCNNGGTCIDEENKFSCICADGWDGDTCSSNIDECRLTNVPCNEDGMDDSTFSGGCEDIVNGYRCHCRPGYEGEKCEVQVNECSSDPCLHGGTCEDAVNDYVCQCVPGWTGKRCDAEVDNCENSPCKNNAPCQSIFNDYVCTCPEGYYSKDCSRQKSVCNDANPCITSDSKCREQDGNVECKCGPGYTGEGCQIKTCLCTEDECQNGGTCISSMGVVECICSDDFEGDHCERSKDDCDSVMCAGNGQCVDGIGNYYCECPVSLGKEGPNCDKDVDSNHDFSFYSTSGTGEAFLAYPFNLGTEGFSVGLWVRFSQRQGTGTFITFLGTNDRLPGSAKSEMLRIDHSGVTLSFGSTSYFVPFSPSIINDGKWYFVLVGWNKATGNLLIVVNTVKIILDQPSYAAGTELPTYGWIVLGSHYRVSSGTPVFSNGILGYVSGVEVWNRVLSFDLEVPAIVDDINVRIEDGLVKRWDMGYQLGAGVEIVFGSTAGQKLCPPGKAGASCEENAPDKTSPSITCPDDVFILSNSRLTQVTWQEPVTSGASTVPSSVLLKGSVVIWGKYTNIYYIYDEAGNGAMCHFDIYVRREDCLEPEPPTEGGTQVCTSEVPNFKNCEPSCPAGKMFAKSTPKFYTCGPLGSFNQKNRAINIKYPQCSEASIKTVQLILKVVYRDIQACDRVKDVNGFVTSILKPIAELNKKWGKSQAIPSGGFCKEDDCSDLMAETKCLDTNSRRKKRATNDAEVTITLNDVQDPLFDSNGNMLSPDDLLNQDIFDLNILTLDNIPNAVPDFEALTLTSSPNCIDGQALIDNQCVDCAAGQYYDASSASCKDCPLGFYQDEKQKTSCKQCPSGLTTKTEGSEDVTACKKTCNPGHYFNGDACIECEIGFYQSNPGQFYCEPCDALKTTPSSGSDSVDDCFNICPDGTQLGADGTCTPCPRGYFRTAGVHDACDSCKDDFTTTSEGSRAESECTVPKCAAGYYITGLTCTECPQGEYQPETVQQSCIKCADGFTTVNTASTDAADCKFICDKGYEEKPADSGRCEPCLIGFFKDNSDPGALCQPCLDSTFTTPQIASISNANCTYRDCVAGEQPNIPDNTECVLCPRGTYQPEPHKETCLACPPDTSTENVGATQESQCLEYCPSGHFKLQISDPCEPCPQGYYKNNSEYEFGECKMCPPEFITQTTASTSAGDCNIANCLPGQYRDVANNICVNCSVGFYQPEKWQEECYPCPTDKTTAGEGSINANECKLDCQPGEEDRNDVCMPCMIGYYKSEKGAAPCTQCPAPYITETEGSVTPDDCDIEDCSTGQFLDTDKKCYVCPVGEYQDKPRQTSCIKCGKDMNEESLTTVGNRSDTHDSVEDCIANCRDGEGYNFTSGVCEICKRGYYRTKGVDDLCTLCPIDKITLSTGSTILAQCIVANCSAGQKRDPIKNECIDCPRGTYQPEKWQDQCIECDSDRATTEFEKSTLETQCRLQCQDGYELNADETSCQECPVRFYRTNDESYRCQECPNGKTTIGLGAKSVDECNIVYCEPGNFVANELCTPCDEGQYQNNPSQPSCLFCPVDKPKTWKQGANSISDCKAVNQCANATLLETCGKSEDGITCVGHECVCRSGWVGEPPNCTHKCNLDSWCLNDAVCIATDLENPVCHCQENWEGERCDIRAAKQSMTPYIIGGSIGGAVFLLLMLLCLLFVCMGPVSSKPKAVPHTQLVNPTYAPNPYMSHISKNPIGGSLAGSLGRSMHSMTGYHQPGLHPNPAPSMTGSKYMFYEDRDDAPITSETMRNFNTSYPSFDNRGFELYEEKGSQINFLEEDLNSPLQAAPLGGRTGLSDDPYSTLEGGIRQ